MCQNLFGDEFVALAFVVTIATSRPEGAFKRRSENGISVD
jgi:hypothetical protein